MRLVNLMLQDGADTKTLGAKTKENREECDRLEMELARPPQGSNVVLHPTAIKAFADKLLAKSSDPFRSNRARLEMTMTALDDMGELGRTWADHPGCSVTPEAGVTGIRRD